MSIAVYKAVMQPCKLQKAIYKFTNLGLYLLTGQRSTFQSSGPRGGGLDSWVEDHAHPLAHWANWAETTHTHTHTFNVLASAQCAS